MAKKAKGSDSQVRGFRKAARDLGADESEARFDAAVKTVARHKPSTAAGKDKGKPST
jgi:hypothetical protein